MLSWDDYHKQESAPSGAGAGKLQGVALAIDLEPDLVPAPAAASANAVGASRVAPTAVADNIARARESIESLDIAPGIVVGRLQHDKTLAPHQQHGLRVRYQWSQHAA